MHTQELQDKLETSLRLVLDSVDFTHGACSLTSMVGAALPVIILDQANAVLEEVREARHASNVAGETYRRNQLGI